MLRVFMMDMLSVVAYYDAHLCRALTSASLNIRLGAITYHFDPDCFRRLGVRNNPGPIDVVGKLKLPATIRRALKVAETFLNMMALSARFTCATPEVVHVQYLPLLERKMPFELWFLRYLRFLGSSLVCTIHDVLPHDTGKKLAGEFRNAYRMMDALICHSEAAKHQLVSLLSIPADRVHVIPHGPFFFDGLDPQVSIPEAEIKSDDCIVLCQGMVRPYKGIEFLLDAWAELRRSGTKARLVIAGTGESAFLGSLREKVRVLGLEDTVELCFEFLSLEKMRLLYKKADVIVYPYKAITTSGALMTGITQRKAIVATTLPAFCELLEHDNNALLCAYGDTVELASALARLIANPRLRERLGNEAAKLSDGWQTWQQIANETKSCYLAALGRQLSARLEGSLAG